MKMNSIHESYIIRSGFGIKRRFAVLFSLLVIFGSMVVHANWQAHRLVGHWQTAGGSIIEINRDGTSRIWTYNRGWSDYEQWHISMPMNSFQGRYFPNARFEIRGNVLSFGDSRLFDYTRVQPPN
ncbi:MAG: hypothetical protein FWB98_06825 [Defluviitaleaceae bacterium]|nr:hypothetical protein [Defluviitaleaceae bacterium]